MTCPGELELSRALSVGAGAALTAHLAACATCRAAWDDAQAAIDLARELPVALPPPARREEVRTAVLAAAGIARRPARRTWLPPAIAAAAAAGVVGALAMSHGAAPPAPHSHGTVRPHPGARYAVTAVGADQIVRLADGVIDVEVEPLHPGERFRVVVGGAALEVRGTAFTVGASAERLTEVAVAHGRVDLAPEAGAPASLGAGQSWHADAAPAPMAVAPPPTPPAAPAIAPPPSPTPPVIAPPAPSPMAPAIAPPAPAPSIPPAIAPPAPAPSIPRAIAPPLPARPPARPRPPAPPRSPRVAVAPSRPAEPPAPVASSRPHRVAVSPPHPAEPPAAAVPSPPPAPSPPATPPDRTPDERSYDDAWAALRTGDFTRAAGGFARVMLLAPDSSLVEDASYWHAVALARGKRSAEAVSAFHDFLAAFGGSAHAGQASAMLGWLLIDARAFDEAARRFRAATGDPDPAVRRSARAGLDALASRTP